VIDRSQVRAALVGASIASQAHHHRDLCGLGEVTVEDMQRFATKAEELAVTFDQLSARSF